MEINKVIFNAKTLIDLTMDTVTADSLVKGKIAHDASGKTIVGTLDVDAIYQSGYDAAFELFKPYKEKLASIRSNGTQHIDTGIVPKVGKTRVVFHDFSILDKLSDWETFFGSDSDDGATDSFRFRRYSSTETLGANWGNANGTYYSNYIYEYTAWSTVDTIEYGCNGLIVDGELATPSETTSPVDGTYPIYLFATNKAGTVFRPSSISFSCCEMYDGDTIVRRYVPVLDFDDVPCLYDEVTRALYYNAGVGQFLYGRAVELPDGYVHKEYIESGGTQHIDTAFTPNQDTRVVADVEIKLNGSNYFLFGARKSSSNNSAASATFGFNAYQTKYRTHYYNGYSDFDTTISYDTRFTVDANKNVTTLNGEHVVTRTYTAFTSPCTMTIFAVNTAGTVGTYGTAKVYSFKIYDNDTLVRDFVPCVNPSGEAGLYDVVNNVFYGNAGTGSFTYA